MSLSVAYCFVSCHSPLAVSQLNTKSEEKKVFLYTRDVFIRRHTDTQQMIYTRSYIDIKIFFLPHHF